MKKTDTEIKQFLSFLSCGEGGGGVRQFDIFPPTLKTSATILLVRSAKIFIGIRQKSGSHTPKDWNMRMLGFLLNSAQEVKKFVSRV